MTFAEFAPLAVLSRCLTLYIQLYDSANMSCFRRRLMVVEGFYEEVVPEMTEDQYRANFRLSTVTTTRVMDHIGQPAYFRKKLLLFLYYLGSIVSFRKVATVFGLSVSTAWSYVADVVTVLINIRDSLIRFPSAERCRVSSDAVLATKGFSGFVGAVDGCHIPIERPREDEHAYINRKGFHSIVLMAVCDERLMFTDVCAGWPGSVHDSRIFKNSPLGRDLTEGTRVLPDGCFLVGDSAFQLEPWLMTPFRNSQMGDDGRGATPAAKRYYNHNLSSARVVIEHTFGVLKARFRRLRFLETKSVRKAVDIVCAACVLHNICMRSDDDWEAEEGEAGGEEVEDAVVAGRPEVGGGGSAARRRFALVEEMMNARQ